MAVRLSPRLLGIHLRNDFGAPRIQLDEGLPSIVLFRSGAERCRELDRVIESLIQFLRNGQATSRSLAYSGGHPFIDPCDVIPLVGSLVLISETLQ